jgi:DNA-binding protein H-NS
MNKQINELRTKIDNIKEENSQDMENLRKKNETELQNKTEGQSSRIEQTEDRISNLKMRFYLVSFSFDPRNVCSF